MKFKAGFIGCGNMGGALAVAVSKAIGGNNVAICDNDRSRCALLCSEYGATVLEFNDLIQNCEYVFIGLKPQIIYSVLKDHIDTINASDTVIITMAAGIALDFYEQTLGIKNAMIRIMPNTPCSIGSGMILYSRNSEATDEHEKEFLSIMSHAGLLDRIDEKLIDAASAVSGCGPAFAFIFSEALADAGVECGLPRDKALLYASQMLKGSAELLLKNGNPGKLKDDVCSPGGTTIAGVHALEEAGFRFAAMNAVTAAYKRTLELNK